MEIDTSRIDERERDLFRKYFGNAASKIRFVPVGHRVVMFVGSNPQLLETAVANIQNREPGLSDHPAVVESERKLDPRHKLELHLSVNNLGNVYAADIRNREKWVEHEPVSKVTSLGLVTRKTGSVSTCGSPVKNWNVPLTFVSTAWTLATEAKQRSDFYCWRVDAEPNSLAHFMRKTPQTRRNSGKTHLSEKMLAIGRFPAGGNRQVD